MPIRGLTDRGAQLPQIGTLRKGAPKQNEKRPGVELKHFRFASDDAEANAAFTEAYGAEPQMIHVFLPYKTTGENFEAWQEAWTAGALQHRCDGQNCVVWLTPGGTYSHDPKPCPGGCRAGGRLKVIVPELKRLALVTVLTTSIHDLITIQGSLEALESARGDLRGIPLLLKRVSRKISTPGEDGKRARREKWLITIEAQPDWVALQLASQAQAALPSTPQLALPEWDGEDDEDDVEDVLDQIENEIRGLFYAQGKSEADWQAYKAKFLTGKPEADKRALLVKLQAAIAKKAAPPSAEEVHGEVVNPELDAVEALIKDLQAAGQKPAEIDAQIARMTGGQIALDEMDEKTLHDVHEGLAFWIETLQKKAAKAS